MTNKTRNLAKREDVQLIDPVLNTSVSGTAVQDDDAFASASATKLASSESIKAYVDANAGSGGGSVTVKNEGTSLSTPVDTLDFTGDGVTASGTGTTKTINIIGVAEIVPKFLATYTNSSDASYLNIGDNATINDNYEVYYLVMENVVPTVDASLLMRLHTYGAYGSYSLVSSGYRQMTYFLGQTGSDTWEVGYLSSTTSRSMWSICGGYANNNLRVDNLTTYKGYNATWRLTNARNFVTNLYPRIDLVGQLNYYSSANYIMGYMYAYKNMWCEGTSYNKINRVRIYFSSGNIRAGAKVHLYGANYG